jgi:hypothetical protein
VATINEGVVLALDCGQDQSSHPIPKTGDWGAFQAVDLGRVQFARPGDLIIKLRPKEATSWKGINLRSISLRKLEDSKQ